MMMTIASAALLVLSSIQEATPESRLPIPQGIERPWIGPDFFANRLQDWRLVDGRVECIEARANLPVRTLHLLTKYAAARPGTFGMAVRLEALESEKNPRAEAFAGFLLGAGGDGVDPRISALVHHKPAEDGGLLAVIDGVGRVALFDFSQGGGGGLWSIGGAWAPGEAHRIEAESRSDAGFMDGVVGAVTLSLRVTSAGETYDLELSAHGVSDGAPVSTATYRGIAPELVDGNLGLVSHLGREDSSTGHRFEDWTLAGDKIDERPSLAFGPILTTQYTWTRKARTGRLEAPRGDLHLTAQFAALGEGDPRTARLELGDGLGAWREIARAEVLEDSFTAPFHLEGLQLADRAPYRVVYELATGSEGRRTVAWEGELRPEPAQEDTLTLAAFTGHKCYTGGLKWNEGGIWFPHQDLVSAVEAHEPDMLFFSGDQIYEGDLTGAHRSPIERAILDYHYKWQRWCWAFSDLTRNRPTICIPDDHDVYHGNIWGAGGRKAVGRQGLRAQDAGGYTMPARFVNMVHGTQTSHLPQPPDPTPVEQDISVYYTDVVYGGVSFAVLGDRQWKSSPTIAVPEGRIVNGWSQNPDFDAKAQSDVPGAVLLGERQERFLEDWAGDWGRGAWAKVVLSQTIFANLATLPPPANTDGVTPGLRIFAPDEYPEGEIPVADGDSNGWPASGRDRALRAMRRGFAFHVAGDQHLGSTVQYGVEAWGDAGFALCVPSIANTFPRRWFPPEPGANRPEGSPRYAGDFEDGFGNKVSVHAVSNPRTTGVEPTGLHDRAPGYGIVKLEREGGTIEMANWPRHVDPRAEDARPYAGWPVRTTVRDQYGRTPGAWMPEVRIEGVRSAVVRVIDAVSDEVLYTLRVDGPSYWPHAFAAGSYHLEVGDPDRGRPLERVLEDFKATAEKPMGRFVTFRP